MKETHYIKIRYDEQIIGGIILEPMEPRHWHVGRIFLAPAYQRRGIGAEAFAWLESALPDVRLWTLRTPEGYLRNQRFYEKLGYQQTGRKEIKPGLTLIEYSRQVGGEIG